MTLRVLAMDAAASGCSAAVWHNSAITACRRSQMARGHAEALLPMVAAVLRDVGCRAEAIDAVAVTVGPGSFTGLRVGMAAARGIALAAGVPCFGVSTLQAIAEQALRSVVHAPAVLVVLDSKRSEVYAQCFAADGGALDGMMAVAPAELARCLPHRVVVLAGDAAAVMAPLLAASGVTVTVAAGTDAPDATAVAALAARRWGSGERPVDGPTPLYLRPPDAVRSPGGGRRRA